MKRMMRIVLCLMVFAALALPTSAFAQTSTSYTTGIQVQNLDPIRC